MCLLCAHVARVDRGGQFRKTVLMLFRLERVLLGLFQSNGSAGSAADVIDLIPFVTGLGEVTRAGKTVVVKWSGGY